MRILHNPGDIFALPETTSEAVCVTTNGIVKRDGMAVMGAGIAKQANQSFDKLALKLGYYLTKYGNRVFDMGVYKNTRTGIMTRIITFPTKYDWRNDSDIELIKTSALQLVELCDKRNITTCYLPCPGCSNGGLDWERQVRPLLEPILDDRFVIADRRL